MAESPVGDIIKDITADVKVLVRGEIELAKAELVPAARTAGIGGGLFGTAGYFGVNALTLLFFGGAIGISYIPGINLAVAFVIMAGLLILLAGVLALIGMRLVKKVKGPERTMAEAKTSVEAVKGAIQRGKAAAVAPRIEGKVVSSRELR